MGGSQAWKRLERGEIVVGEYYEELENEIKASGEPVPEEFSPRALLAVVSASLKFRVEMIDAIHCLKRKGDTVAALTNNWKQSEDFETRFHHSGLFSLFHKVFEVSIAQ